MSGRELVVKLPGGTFLLSVDAGGGNITSALHYESLEQFLEDGSEEYDDVFDYGRYEGAIDALESIILAAAEAGIDVEAEPFATALQSTLDAIGSNL